MTEQPDAEVRVRVQVALDVSVTEWQPATLLAKTRKGEALIRLAGGETRWVPEDAWRSA